MSSKDRNLIKSILLIDDDQDALDMYSSLMKKKLTGKISLSKYPSQAPKDGRRSSVRSHNYRCND